MQAQQPGWCSPPSAQVQKPREQQPGLRYPALVELPGPERCLWFGWAWRRQRCLASVPPLLPGSEQPSPLVQQREQQPGQPLREQEPRQLPTEQPREFPRAPQPEPERLWVSVLQLLPAHYSAAAQAAG